MHNTANRNFPVPCVSKHCAVHTAFPATYLTRTPIVLNNSTLHAVECLCLDCIRVWQ